MEGKDNTIRRRLTASYITSVVSITLVLFLLGIGGILILNGRKLSNYVKENIGISVYLTNDEREVHTLNNQNTLDEKVAVKETKYLSCEKPSYKFKKNLGADFVAF